MKKATLACMLLLATIWTPGCISVHSTKRTSPPRPPAPQQPMPAPVVPMTPPPTEAEAMMIKEIDAVNTLSSQNRRMDFYTMFAKRTDLGPRIQVYLVDTTFKRLSSQSDRMVVLKTLIANPSFTPEAKSAIIDRLEGLSSQSDRAEILGMLTRR